MRIEYNSRARLPSPLYKQVLDTAYVHILLGKQLYGSDALVDQPCSIRGGNVVFRADDDEHGPSRTMTYGILEEAMGELREFMRRRPNELQAFISEGLVGGGPPIGDIVIMTLDELSTTGTGSAETEYSR